MRRILMTLALLLLIAVGITSSTLAVYTTEADVAADAADTKRFDIRVVDADDFDIQLIPGERQVLAFSVTNVDADGSTAEVTVDLTITGDFASLMAALPGLTVTLAEEGVPLAVQQEDGSLRYFEENAFDADVAQRRAFTLTLDATACSVATSIHTKDISLHISAVQH